MTRLVYPLLAMLCALPVPPELAAQSLRGSPTEVQRQWEQAHNHDLHFYETTAGVYRAADRGSLVELSGNADYRVHNVRYPYVLPIAEVFVRRLAAQYRSACGEQLVVTSAVRPRSFRLPNSVSRSVHPTGMAIDLRRSQNGRCLSWIRATLRSLDGVGIISATEERFPPHFHVSIFPRQYLAYVERRSGGQVLASATPPGITEPLSYQVRRGDTLWSIARQHDVTVDNIKSANNLNSPRIMAGQTLTIPATR